MAVRLTPGRITIAALLAVAGLGAWTTYDRYAVPLPAQTTVPECRDHIDNDGDGLIDYSEPQTATIGGDLVMRGRTSIGQAYTPDIQFSQNSTINSITASDGVWCPHRCNLCPGNCSAEELERCTTGEGTTDGCAQPTRSCSSLKVTFLDDSNRAIDVSIDALLATGQTPSSARGMHFHTSDVPVEDNSGTCSFTVTYVTYDPDCSYADDTTEGDGSSSSGGSSSTGSSQESSGASENQSSGASSAASEQSSGGSSQASSGESSGASSEGSSVSSGSSQSQESSGSSEQSEPSSVSSTSVSSSTGYRCGDGELQGPGADGVEGNADDEECEPAGTSTCTQNCKIIVSLTHCGDKIVSGGEVCDDGNEIDDDACDNDCNVTGITNSCGNSVKEEGEECDDGDQNNTNACSNLCQVVDVPLCGNKNMDAGEQCDDGNLLNNDGCNDACVVEVGGQCDPNACANGGWPICQGAEVCQTINQLPCIQCVAGVGAQCTGQECRNGGDQAAAALGMECATVPNLPCVQFIPRNACGNGRIDRRASTVVDPGCAVAGTSHQLCILAGTQPPNNGEYRPEYKCYQGAHCRMSEGQCSWENTASLQQCLNDNAQAWSPSVLAAQVGGSDCVRAGCFGELCVDRGAVPSAGECVYSQGFACYESTTCEWNGETCAWRRSPELQRCLLDNAASTCPSDQSCLTRAACGAVGGTVGNACGADSTSVCCAGAVTDAELEQCDDGNRVDDDGCNNECKINCDANVDCPEGACVEGQCEDVCAAGPVARVDASHGAAPEENFFLELLAVQQVMARFKLLP